ncbi:hypothetical protein BAU67_001921 [Escherichia coli]|nr:hypothetical protein [Escherichia coli]EMB7054161.1 hypothetical protein [Escherichia coli]
MEQTNNQTVAMNGQGEQQQEFFLGLSKDQVALLVVLSSFVDRLAELLKQPESETIFKALREEEKYQRLDYALGWVAQQRDMILTLTGTANFAMGLLAQVQDKLLQAGFAANKEHNTDDKGDK